MIRIREVTGDSVAQKSFAVQNSVDSSGQFTEHVHLCHVALCADMKAMLDNIPGGLQADEQYLRFRCDSSDLARGIESAQFWKPNIEKNEIGLQFLGSPNSFQPIRCFADDLIFRIVLKSGRDEPTPRFVIIHD